MGSANNDFRSIGTETVPRQFWQDQFQRWKDRTLRTEWADQHPDIFDSDDLKNNQPSKYFSEWYAAVLIKQRLDMLSLISKYGYHGHRNHPRKQEVLRRYLTPEQHAYVITNPKELFVHSTGWPDLFVYKPDSTQCLFCEVKSPTDSLSDKQIAVFNALHEYTGIEVVLFSFVLSG